MRDIKWNDKSKERNGIKKLSMGKVIYGVDDRYDVLDYPSKKFQNLARSTAAQIPRDLLQKKGEVYLLQAKKLSENGVCKEEKFSDQLAPANCSGFLVGEDLLVTAGHCMQSKEDCRYYNWVFGFTKKYNDEVTTEFPLDNIYSCQKIIVSKYDPVAKRDYALIKLDRPVYRRKPLAFRKKGKVDDEAEVIVIGHPSGLPTKIADNARVRNNEHPLFFNANLDTFQGNSGSAVFNKKTGIVEGILVRGDTDYITQDSCMVINRCEDDGCRGEDVTRITLFKNINEIIKANKKRNLKAIEGFLGVKARGLPLELPDKGILEYPFLLKADELISSIRFFIKVFHPMIDDLKISLVHPSGEEVFLNAQFGGFRQLVWSKTFFESERTNGLLGPFLGLGSKGKWVLKIEDSIPFDKGKLEGFSFFINERAY